MRIVFIVILIDFFIFSLGAMFAEKEHKIHNPNEYIYHVDRYGYNWSFEEE